MKILLISPSPPEYLGGLSLFAKGLAKNLGEKDIKVDFLCSSLTRKKGSFEKYSKNVFLVKKKCYLFSDYKNFLRVKNPLFNVLSYLIKYGKNYDLIHVHSYIYFSTIQTFFYKTFFNRNIPLVLHLHGGVQTSGFQSSNFKEKVLLFIKKYFFDLVVGKSMLRKATAIVSVSKEDLLSINQVFKVFRTKNNYYIPNVVNIQNLKKDNRIRRKFFGFIGRLTLIKGIDLFMQLIEKYSKIDKNQEYLIIGDGPFLTDVKEAVKKYPITFYKRIPHEKMPSFYNQCSIFIQTSRAEGLPTCVLEALACEVPVVASKVGGIPEIIEDGVNGYAFKSGNIDQAINQILLITEKNNHEILGKNGRKIIENRYSWNIIIKKIIRIYREITLKS
ncbi:MAG: glycosyltransferase family 4 protein [Promethearchaeota archaeon]|jgi:glycosyltransferase involved in cell wall biosynthesis